MMKALLIVLMACGIAEAGTHIMRGDAAGGDLSGTYPNPTVNSITGSVLQSSAVAFGSSTGTITSDQARFTWDKTNKNLNLYNDVNAPGFSIPGFTYNIAMLHSAGTTIAASPSFVFGHSNTPFASTSQDTAYITHLDIPGTPYRQKFSFDSWSYPFSSFEIFNVVYDTTSLQSTMTVSGINLTSLSNSQFVKSDASDNLISYDLLNATQTWTGGNTFASPLNSSFTYGVIAATMTDTGMVITGPAGNNWIHGDTTAADFYAGYASGVLSSRIGDTGIGFQSLSNTVSNGNFNTAVGASSLQSVTSGPDNTCEGLDCAALITTGFYNTCSGEYCLGNITSGGYNVGLGYGAGAPYAPMLYKGNSSVIDSSMTFIGSNTGRSVLVSTGTSMRYGMAIGAGAVVSSSFTAQIGGTNGSTAEVMVFASSATFNQVTVTGTNFALLPASLNGSILYCSDCTTTTPATCTANLLTSCVCAGSGSGALAKRINGTWYCN